MGLREVQRYDAYDGAPYASETTGGDVSFLDMSVPVYHLDKYDWTVSIEVVEHIPAQFESVFLDNLVQHARQAVHPELGGQGPGWLFSRERAELRVCQAQDGGENNAWGTMPR
jgi:hypothetical protein